MDHALARFLLLLIVLNIVVSILTIFTDDVLALTILAAIFTILFVDSNTETNASTRYLLVLFTILPVLLRDSDLQEILRDSV